MLWMACNCIQRTFVGRYLYFIPHYSFAEIPSSASSLCLCFNRTSAFYLQFSFISQNQFTILLEQRPSSECLHFLFLCLFVSTVSCIKYVLFIVTAVPVVHFFLRFLCFENQNQRCNNEKALGEQIPSSCIQDWFRIWKGFMFKTNATTTPANNTKQSHACFAITGCNHVLKWWNCTYFTFITFICISFSNFVLLLLFFLVLLLRISVYPFSFFCSCTFLLPVAMSDNIRCSGQRRCHAAQRIRLKAKCWIIFVVSWNCYLVIAQQTRTSLSYSLWQRVTVDYRFFRSSGARCCVHCKIK